MGTDTTDLSQPVAPETRIYGYDPIGNRNSATEGTEVISYAPNALNQYESITGNGGAESLVYDEDGNLTEYNDKVYTYNAENRLVAVAPKTPGDGDTKVEFIYDYMGRRAQKSVFTYTSGSWLLTSDSLFVYNSWNLIEEIKDDGSTEASKYYVWGLDLSQSIQGAGGIGGLIASVDTETGVLYYFQYDGNGNVGQLVNRSDGSIAAHYEYDPYGNTILASGDYADQNTFRFSTKFFDNETELYYYGYRYYSTELGRWINHDSMEEYGGLNLYCFVLNSPISRNDILGKFSPRYHEEIIKNVYRNEIKE